MIAPWILTALAAGPDALVAEALEANPSLEARTYGDELLPAAQLALDTTLWDCRVGRADFASLCQAWITLLDLERGRLVALVDTHLAASRVRALAGQLGSSS